MHLFYCDETNLEQVAGDFLVYGGLVVPGARVLGLSQKVDEIRAEAKIPPDFRLKFNPGPDDLSHEAFAAVKQDIIEAAVEHDAKLVVYVILHDIATSPDDARRNGINTVCYQFDQLLRYHHYWLPNQGGGPGLVLIDRFQDKRNQIDHHLREKFATGLADLPDGREVRLANIVGFHYSTVGQSHVPSVVDITLGSLRFAMNACTRKDDGRKVRAMQLLELVGPMFLRNHEGTVSKRSFQFRPETVNYDAHRERYLALKEFLAEGGITTEQPIGGGWPC